MPLPAYAPESGYDFEVALETALAKSPDSRSTYWDRFDAAPTRDQLIRHAELYRSECVQETAEQHTTYEIAELLNVTHRTVIRYLPDVSTTSRRRHDAQVLRRRGMAPTAVADKLNLSDERVRYYLRRAGVR